ncbi:fibronectin type III domain-containing protein [Streptomyces sp. NPDC090073]|uniref:fibronectin type III domain-containing protein n=1 Tax=Streptomyces sp. NPDC090073 TaxID=3365936 RepID=UPI00382D9B96
MSALTGKVDVPGVGGVDKRVLIGVGGVAAVFIGWRFYQARSAAAYDPAADAVDPGMEDPGVLPSVSGAVSPDNSYGLPDPSTNTSDSYGFHGKTNSEWTQYAAGQLSQASDSWSYAAIVTGLGKFINNRALTTQEQAIVQAAIAVAGYPPEGSHVIIPGGDTKINVAPTGVKVASTTQNTVVLTWNPVAGAQSYRGYRSGASTNVGTVDAPLTKMTISGLQPNTEYSFQIAADSIGDTPGPKSSPVKAKTKPVALKAPTAKVSSIAATAATVSWTKVSGATSYRVYINGHLRGTADGGLSSYRVTGLSKKTKYKATVRADTTNQEPGPESKPVSFTTKSK